MDTGEFCRLLNGDSILELDDDSVHGAEELTNLNCEGIFDEENPPMFNAEGDKLMGLESEENHEAVLKQLGNSKYKPFLKNALEDGFVVRKQRLSDVVTIRAKVLAKEQCATELTKMAVDYFIVECNKCRKSMIEQTAKEKGGEMLNYEMKNWERDYLEYVNETQYRYCILHIDKCLNYYTGPSLELKLCRDQLAVFEI